MASNRSFKEYVTDRFYNELFAAIKEYIDENTDDLESCKQWFMLKCSDDLNCSLDDFVIEKISLYSGKNKQTHPMSDSMVPVSVKAKTIFVDPNAYFLYNLGKVNNTIVHECVHWDKHGKAFELERLYICLIS